METITIKEAEGAMPIKSDFEYIRGLDPQGNPIRLNKADVAKVLEGLIPVVTSSNNGLMSKDGFFEKNTLVEGADFNKITISGYYLVISAQASSLVNFPDDMYPYGTLIVFKLKSFVTQIYIPDSNSSIIYRTSYNERWLKWKYLAAASNLPISINR